MEGLPVTVLQAIVHAVLEDESVTSAAGAAFGVELRSCKYLPPGIILARGGVGQAWQVIHTGAAPPPHR